MIWGFCTYELITFDYYTWKLTKSFFTEIFSLNQNKLIETDSAYNKTKTTKVEHKALSMCGQENVFNYFEDL